MSPKIKISVRNLSKTFDTKVVLSRINLDIEEGKSLAILGGSGSGKSVLLKCIVGILNPDQNSKIMIENENVATAHIKDRTKWMTKFGMLFQGNALFDSLPIWHNICFQKLYYKTITAKFAKDLATHKLEMVGLSSNLLDLYPAQISGGMQKRVGLARAIANDPEVIFFDEPTAGLDPLNAKIISELIKKLSQELKATTVTITHDMMCMEMIADKIAMINAGNIIWQGTSEAIVSSGNSYVDSFVKAARGYKSQ